MVTEAAPSPQPLTLPTLARASLPNFKAPQQHVKRPRQTATQLLLRFLQMALTMQLLANWQSNRQLYTDGSKQGFRPGLTFPCTILLEATVSYLHKKKLAHKNRVLTWTLQPGPEINRTKPNFWLRSQYGQRKKKRWVHQTVRSIANLLYGTRKLAPRASWYLHLIFD